jgi:ABC-2 type transport system permease protein
MNILVTFFLWSTVFSDPSRSLFGYDRAKILTYVFGVMILRALVLSARAVDVSREISNGDILNLLVRPINYFKYWFTRDIASKALNLGFAAVEFAILYLILRPAFYFQTNIGFLFGFSLMVFLAVFIFFCLLFIVNMIPFWAPNMGWGAQFLIIVVIVEFLSGAIFPIDILPGAVQNFLYATPFPYLVFVPIQVYLGKVSTAFIVKGVLISLFWSVALWIAMNNLWKKGLKAYEGVGK